MKVFISSIILLFCIVSYGDECLKNIGFPFESTILLIGRTYDIMWEINENCKTSVKIELFQEGRYILTIIPEADNNGIFSWTVPESLKSPILKPYNYSIKITDLLNPNNYIESELFVVIVDYIYPMIIIPAAVHSKGGYNSYWKTDLFFYNSFDLEDKIDIYVFFFREGREENEPPIGYYFEMQKGEIKIIEDVVKNAFKTSGAGLILLDEHYMHQVYWPIQVSAILYNDMGDKGILGTHMPSMGDIADKYDFTNKSLLNLKENENFRTNIGIASSANFPIDIKILIYDDSANLIGEKYITLPPYAFYQEYRIYKQFTSNEINKGFIRVTIMDSYNRHFVYPFASVIDNRFGNIYFIPQF